jgi:hypothetical protein
MGEIITEFNSTAERNITILENKISILKRLLNEAGNIKGIDMRVFDNGDLPGMKGETKLQTLEEKNTPVERKPSHTKEVTLPMKLYLQMCLSCVLLKRQKRPKQKLPL